MDSNPLEMALEEATRDPGARPVFYRVLLESEVIVLLRSKQELLSEGGLQLMTWLRDDGVVVVPFFSSLEVCKKVAGANHPRAVVSARKFFDQIRGYDMHLHLNPTYIFGREFLPEEIDSLLTRGTIGGGVTSAPITESIRLVQMTPSENVSAIQSALCSLLSRWRHVRAAYLLEVERSDFPGQRSLLLKVVSPRHEALLHAISSVFVDVYSGSLAMDILFVDSGGESEALAGC